MVGGNKQTLLHTPANNDNASGVAKDRGMSEAIQGYLSGQKSARHAQWCGLAAAGAAVGTAIYAGQLIGLILAAVICMMTISLWLAFQTIISLYELAKIQREHIDFLERIKLGDGN